MIQTEKINVEARKWFAQKDHNERLGQHLMNTFCPAESNPYIFYQTDDKKAWHDFVMAFGDILRE